jgi:hypothetical protein
MIGLVSGKTDDDKQHRPMKLVNRDPSESRLKSRTRRERSSTGLAQRCLLSGYWMSG